MNINVGGPPVVISQPPDFLYPPELGYGVAVGVPYDLFYSGGIYYIYRGGGWYRTHDYGGRWVKLRHRDLPPELRRYRIGRIHEFRDREYRVYRQDREHYRGRYYRPGPPPMEHRDMRGRGPEHRDEMRGRGPEHRDEMRGRGPERREDRRDERGDEHRGERHDERR